MQVALKEEKMGLLSTSLVSVKEHLDTTNIKFFM